LRIVDSGTSATPPDLLLAIRMLVPGATRRVFYGSTEAGAVCLLLDERMEAKPGTCGVPQHSVRVRLDPATHELQVRGPLLFDGYFEDPTATAEVTTDDGWFRTGDIGRIDDGGYIFVEDRLKDMIISGGENIYSIEVERVLAEHPAVVDVAIIGIPDDKWGEVVKAVVQLEGEATEAELIAFARERLAAYKCPKSVDVKDELPRNPTGKILKKDLRKQYWEGRDRTTI
jgi:acyl-CoA synthetase (AMP-forming)/AMP-acid ligase II